MNAVITGTSPPTIQVHRYMAISADRYTFQLLGLLIGTDTSTMPDRTSLPWTRSFHYQYTVHPPQNIYIKAVCRFHYQYTCASTTKHIHQCNHDRLLIGSNGWGSSSGYCCSWHWLAAPTTHNFLCDSRRYCTFLKFLGSLQPTWLENEVPYYTTLHQLHTTEEHKDLQDKEEPA